MPGELSEAVITEAVWLIKKACARLGNDDRTQANTPERARFVDTLALLWEAAGILDPDCCHPEDAARYRAGRAALRTRAPAPGSPT